MVAFPSPERLARFSTRRPWLVVAIWVALLAAGGAAATRIGSALTTNDSNYVDTESGTASDLLDARLFGGLPATETVVIQSPTLTVDDPAFVALIAEVTAKLRALDREVASATNIIEAPSAVPVSEDRHTTIIPVALTSRPDDASEHVDELLKVVASFDGVNGFTVVTGGDGSVPHAFNETSEKDLQTAEKFGIPIALIILALVFGALVAAGLPMLLGIVSIVIAVGAAAVIGQAFELSFFLVNFVTTMGLAVGIDYALIIVKRFREERTNGLDRDAAIIKAGGTASRAVLFSGIAVIVALCGMLLVPQSIFVSLGLGAILVVAVAVAAALTLLPAILRLLGDKVNAVRIGIPGRRARVRSGASFWERSTGLVTRHPVISLVLSAGLLIALAVPYAGIRLGWAGVSSLPGDTSARRAFDILDKEFSAGLLAPAQIVVDSSDVGSAEIVSATNQLAEALRADGRFGTPTLQPNDAGNLLLITVPLAGDSQSNAARRAVTDLRDTFVKDSFAGTGARVLVTGATAEGMDNTELIDNATVPVFAFVLGLSFFILLVVFRSIVVPIKAMIMNLLSVGAAYGLMVVVFQHGIGNELFGFNRSERIESWVPLFMFAVLFGLSMDYHVFLLTRIREHFEHTRDNTASIIYGVKSTAGMITGAAAIMISVFAGFAAGEMTAMQQMGFGLAVAVLLDATIVRAVLVPASMQLLGAKNWYFPRWLEWLPRVDVEGHRADEPVKRTPARAPEPAVTAAGQ